MSDRLPRRVLLGVSGGIAAYKSAFLVRELIKAGAEVRVVMTRSAHDFVTPLTLSTLSKHPVLTTLVDREEGEPSWNDHVELARWADVFLVAPATANTISKMHQGICDNLLMACYLSATCPVFIAPAMDLEMYRDQATHFNLGSLRERGVQVIGPATGELASGLEGEGRMSEPEEIVHELSKALLEASPWAGKRLLVTAGPTQEAIDPVRYIGNRSSGRMGCAIAEEAAKRGAVVELVLGPVEIEVDRPGITRHDVVSAADMEAKCKELFPESGITIMCAAVADLRPVKAAQTKLKKDEADLTLSLERTTDILAWMGSTAKKGGTLVGFALETDDGIEHAQGKLQRKNLDMIVLNTMEDTGAGFGHTTNKVTFLYKDNTMEKLPLMSKTDVARHLLDSIGSRFLK